MVMGLFTVFWLSFGLINLPTLELGTPFATPNGKYSEVHPQEHAAAWLCHTVVLLIWRCININLHRSNWSLLTRIQCCNCVVPTRLVGINARCFLATWLTDTYRGFALFTFFIFTLKVNFVFAALFFIVSIGAWLLSAACKLCSCYPWDVKR